MMSSQYYYEFAYDSYYCYDSNGILRNKLNIKNQKMLSDAERKITSLRMGQLFSDNKKFTFDGKGLCEIHRHIFSDLYEWAGEYRKVDIAKGNMFCRSIFIEEQMDEIMKKLSRDEYLCGKKQDDLAIELAHYLGDINAIHPFREGNGRTQRVFIQLLARFNGYDIDYSKITENEMLEASKLSFDRDYRLMEELIKRALFPIH